MATSVNPKGVANAKALIAAGKVNEGTWNFTADDGNALLGANGDDWENYAQWFLAVHPDATPDTKAYYGYPFGEDGEVYYQAVVTAKGRASQQDATDVMDACSTLLEMMTPAGKSTPTGMQRAYSIFTIKQVNEDQRIIEGIATTPSTDRMGDIVEPMGAQFKLPLPLLWQHDSNCPVGEVISAQVTKAGIKIKAQFADIAEPGMLKDMLDMAWQSVKIGLVKGLSIGFIPLESEQIDNSWCQRFISWDFMELSCVTVPANAEATILSIKSADRAALAASGVTRRSSVSLNSSPGASGKKAVSLIPPKKENIMATKSVAEQISAFEAKRSASAARMDDIMSKSADEGRTLEDAESQEYDGLAAEVKQVDEHLARLKAHEMSMVAKATEVRREVIVDEKSANDARGGSGNRGNGVITVHSNLEKGIPFVRYVKALVQAKGIPILAHQIAEANQHWKDTSPEVAMVLKAAVAAGDTTTSGWASELVYNQNLVAAFLEYLRPKTIIGRIQGFTQVPFNVRWGSQTSGSTGYWVGQGKPIPVSKLGTGSATLGIAKAAGLVVIDKELMFSSAPSAEMLVRDDLAKAIAQFLDVNFIAPDYAAVANVNPASITNGVDPTAATGTAAANLRTDAEGLFTTWDNNNLSSEGAVWVMTPATARAISLMITSLGTPLYPTMTPDGGTFMGYPVVVSQSAMMVGSPVAGEGHLMVLISPQNIAMADEGGVTIDASEEASIEMLDNPTNQSTSGTVATSMVSMFQTDSVALRAIRHINWVKRRNFAVQFIKDAAYTA